MKNEERELNEEELNQAVGGLDFRRADKPTWPGPNEPGDGPTIGDVEPLPDPDFGFGPHGASKV